MTAPATWVQAAMLAELPLMVPPLLWTLARRWSVEELWHGLAAGTLRADDLCADDGRSVLTAGHRAAWAAGLRSVDPDRLQQRYVEAGVRVVFLGGPDYPAKLAADPQPPLVLFCRGSVDALTAPRTVGIVGTRKATSYGRQVARRFGAGLAAEGVTVVSGLALGIDGAAHQGALEGRHTTPVVGVVGTGVDRVYPSRHAQLWHQVIERGALVSEAPLGTVGEPFRFPLRNRIIAALSDVVIVVESGAVGGSMITASLANDRDKCVLAVPGPILADSSAGTNSLLSLGTAQICTGLGDVRTALGLATAGQGLTFVDPRPHPDASDAQVLRLIDWDVVSVETVMARTGGSLGAATTALVRLEAAGWVSRGGAGWYRVATMGER